MLPSSRNVALLLKCCLTAENIVLLLRMLSPAENVALLLKCCPPLPVCRPPPDMLPSSAEMLPSSAEISPPPEMLACCWQSSKVKKHNTQTFHNFYKGFAVLNLTHSNFMLCIFFKSTWVRVSWGSVSTWLTLVAYCGYFSRVRALKGSIWCSLLQIIAACAVFRGIFHMCSRAGPTCCSHMYVFKYSTHM